MVLRWVEHLQQCRRRITAPVVADLVDLIEHDHGITRARLFESTRDPARECPDVGPPVSADLGFVVNAAERSEEHTSELQSHSDLVCRLLLEKKKQRNDIVLTSVTYAATH